jgi:hypothetical protein
MTNCVARLHFTTEQNVLEAGARFSAAKTSPPLPKQSERDQEHQQVGDPVKLLGWRLAHEPDAEKIRPNREGQQRQGGGETTWRELPERKIGHNLHQVHESEEHDCGADQRHFIEALRQNVDLIGRRANLDQRRHETSEQATQDTHCRIGPISFYGRSPDVGSKPHVKHEAEPDGAHAELDHGIRYVACEQPGGADAEDGTGHQNFQIPGMPMAAVDPHRDGVLTDEDRQ